MTVSLDDDSINVKNFGAIGDGIADDTAAINAASQAVLNTFRGVTLSNGLVVLRAKELYFPSGHYLISGPINILSPVVNIRSVGGATIRQTAAAPIFVVANGGGGSAKIKVQGLQFLYGTTQILFSNNNINATMLKIEDCEFRESTDFAIKAIGINNDLHLSAVLIIENSRFMDSAGVLENHADIALIKDSWVQVSSPNLQANASVFLNVSGNLKFDNVLFVPSITQAAPRVAGVHWVRLNGGSLFVSRTRFGGEGAGYPIVRFEGNGLLSGGSSGTITTYPYMGAEITIENSQICAGGQQTPDAAVININKGMPHTIRVVNNSWLTDSPIIRINNPIDSQGYINSAPTPAVAQQVLNYVIGPNMARPSVGIPAMMSPFLR